ncbi:MAG: response regulator [Nannocystaceae bacterium]|nr:response regulator [Nannocystaceae bacterium]
MVEDSRAMRAYVSAILEAHEFEVEEAENGFEALRMLPREHFDVVVADVNMPDVNGIELTRFVRRGPRQAEIAVLVISTDAAAHDVERAMTAGANGFLPKPFTEQQLLEAIANARSRVQASA